MKGKPGGDTGSQSHGHPRATIEAGIGQESLASIRHTGQIPQLSPRRVLRRNIARIVPQRDQWGVFGGHGNTGQETSSYGKFDW